MGVRSLWCRVLACALCSVSVSSSNSSMAGVYESMGPKTACRRNTDDKTSRDPGNVAVTRVGNLAACKALCDAISDCNGIEFDSTKLVKESDGNCEIWKTAITHHVDSTTFECFKKKSGGVTPPNGFQDAVKSVFAIVSPEAMDFKLTDVNTTEAIETCFTAAVVLAKSKVDQTKDYYKTITITQVNWTVVNTSSVHAHLVFASQRHVVDLHNFIRALQIQHEFVGYGDRFVKLKNEHTLTADMTKCLNDQYNKTDFSVAWDDTSMINLKSGKSFTVGGSSGGGGTPGQNGSSSGGGNSGNVTGGTPGQNGSSSGGGNSGNGSNSGGSTQEKNFTQSVTAKMDCADVTKTMADPKKAEAAFAKAFETGGGVKVTETTLTKIGCGRRLETGFRKLTGETGIKADYKYTATAANTVNDATFTTNLGTALTAGGIEGVTVKGATVEAAVEQKSPTTKPANPTNPTTTKKTASSARKTSLLFVSFSFVLLAHASC